MSMTSKRRASDGCFCPAPPFSTSPLSPSTMGFTRKGSFEPPPSPDVLRSNGIDFVIDRPLARSPTKMKTKKRLVAGAEKPRYVSLLPAFAHRSRSESCGGAIDPNAATSSATAASEYQSPPARLSPETTQSPQTPTPTRPIRPRMIRKASSAGDLKEVGLDSTPRAPYAPGKRQDSLKKSNSIYGPFTPDSAGRAITRPLQQMLPLSTIALDTPPRTPTPSRKRASLVHSPSPLKALSRKIRIRSRTGSNGAIVPVITTSEHSDSHSIYAASPIDAPGASFGQESGNIEATFISDGFREITRMPFTSNSRITIKSSAQPIDVECVEVVDESGQSSWEVRIKRKELSTPMPPTTTFFTSPPPLSYSSTPSPTTAQLLTPETASFAEQQAISNDVFWTQESAVLPSWSIAAGGPYASDDDVPLPLTPKRRGFILPEDFNIKAISPDLRNVGVPQALPVSPRTRHPRQPSSRSRSSTVRGAFSPTPSASSDEYDSDSLNGRDEPEDDWHNYGGILNDTLDSASISSTSSLAKRRLGKSLAKGLRLGLDACVDVHYLRPASDELSTSHEAEISRWSESEATECDDTDSVFSLDV